MPLESDPDLLTRFEAGINTRDITRSEIPATVLGYGEISTVFQIGTNHTTTYKRMPLFDTVEAARQYLDIYHNYCRHLKTAGLMLPEDDTRLVNLPGRPVTLYILQQLFPAEWFAHHLIQHLPEDRLPVIFQRISSQVTLLKEFNRRHLPELELALDGQLSNWVFENGDPAQGRLYYIDTSTPLYRLEGREQLNPELFLQSAPSFLRWVIRRLFLADVMNRYYDQRQILIDLAANLHKEQRPDLVPAALNSINAEGGLPGFPLTVEEVTAYYREDKTIWTLFLAFRRLDRWLKTMVLRQRYEFILPGKIRR